MMSSTSHFSDDRFIADDQPTNPLVIDPPTVQALVTAGFNAIQHNNVRQSDQIFKFLSAVRPDKDFGAIGIALGELTEGRFSDGEQTLRRARGVLHDSDELKAFHVLALLLCGRIVDAHRLQQELASTVHNTAMMRFAESLGQEISMRAAPPRAHWSGNLLDQSVHKGAKP